MNPFDLSASDLLIWGLACHLIADWPLQNDWMAKGKVWPWRWSIAGLAPAFVHANIHGLFKPEGGPNGWLVVDHRDGDEFRPVGEGGERRALIRVIRPMLMDVGTEVRFWTDQVFHIACIAIAALVVGSL